MSDAHLTIYHAVKFKLSESNKASTIARIDQNTNAQSSHHMSKADGQLRDYFAADVFFAHPLRQCCPRFASSKDRSDCKKRDRNNKLNYPIFS